MDGQQIAVMKHEISDGSQSKSDATEMKKQLTIIRLFNAACQCLEAQCEEIAPFYWTRTQTLSMVTVSTSKRDKEEILLDIGGMMTPQLWYEKTCLS